MKDPGEVEELKTLYTEDNNNFRFFLTWRQLLLAGYFAVFAAMSLAFRWSLQHNPGEASIIPFVGSVVSILFWMLDYRNYQLIAIAAQAASAIEKHIGDPKLGYHTSFDKDTYRDPNADRKVRRHKFLQHRVILDIIYFGGAALMLAAAILCLALPYSIKPDTPVPGKTG